MIRRLLQRVSPRSLQEAALAERCIVVNEHDQVIGDASKRDCHRVHPDGNIILHRAFRFRVLNSNKSSPLVLMDRRT
jgi:isopentenyl-diphosphate delta-isomerase